MTPKLKPLREQVMVITGASSGIGLVTARKAAAAGARLVLVARGEDALRTLADEIKQAGGEAIYVAADVGREEDVARVAQAALQRFGGFDTWINDAAVAIYGKLEEVSIEDQKRLWDTNYWGLVYGSRIACAHLRRHGGKLINIGSALSEQALPIQGVYSASKAAVKAYTDALRMELEEDGAPVSVTLIKPGAIDTPYTHHAANYTGVEPQNPPPVYAPDMVAEAILHAAEHHEPELVVGAGGKLVTLTGRLAPGLTHRIIGRLGPRLQRGDKPMPGVRKGALYEPSGEGLRERGGYPHTREHSVHAAMARHRWLTAAAAGGAAAVLYGLSRRRGGAGRAHK